MKLKEMREQRHAKARKLREILNDAEQHDGFTEEQRTEFDRLDAEITELDTDIRRVEAVEARDAAGQHPDDSDFGNETPEQRAANAEADRQRIEQFRSREGRDPDENELRELRGGLGSQRKIAEDLNEYRRLTYGGVPQDEDEYRQMFYRYLTVRGQVNAGMSHDEFRVLSTATNPGGGYIVPVTFEKTLLERARDFGVMRQLATIMTTQTGEKITQPAEDTHGVAAWIATNGSYAASDEAFNQITFDAYKAGTMILVAEELLQDASFDLAAYIARQFAARIGILENTAYVVGDGVGKPTGIVTSAQVGATLANGNTAGFTTDGAQNALFELYHSVIQAYRNRGSWLAKDATVLKIRLVRDANGQYMWQPGLQAGQPDTLLGRPLHTDPDMPEFAANSKVMLFGDFSYYVIRDVQGVGMQRLNELFAANGQVGFRQYHRTEGKLVNTDAVKALAASPA